MNSKLHVHLTALTRWTVLALLMVPRDTFGAETPASPAGHWEGEISVPTAKLGVRLDLKQTENAWSGTIDIPKRGLNGLKLGGISVEGSAIRFAMPGIPGDPAFAGKLNADGSNMNGDFTQGGKTLPFVLTRKDGAATTAAVSERPGKVGSGPGLAGFWMGSIKPGPVIELRLSLEIKKTADGRLEGVLISLDQGNARIPMSATVEDGGKVKLRLPQIGGSFDGNFNADGSEFSGEWKQGGQPLPLKFKRLEHAAALNRPQEPKKPLPYAEKEVVVENKPANVKLAGTLTLPPGAKRHPAVVLITGSGPQDRDESLMGHRPFLVLADHLARHGIAVLRFDDRGVGKSTGNFAKAVHTDFVGDALACVEFLRGRSDIDSTRIGLIGHSEGGIVAPLAAAKEPDKIAFVVLLAGVGVPMRELMIRQSTDIARVLGVPEAQTAKLAETNRAFYPRLIEAADTAAAEKMVRELIEQQMSEYPPEARAALNMAEAGIASQVKMAASPWFRKLIAYDPKPTLRQVKCPVLAINGDKDLQVSAKENLAGIRDGLIEGGNQWVEVVEFPGLNHLFQTCTTGAVTEYGKIEETFAPAALNAISDWIRKQTRL